MAKKKEVKGRRDNIRMLAVKAESTDVYSRQIEDDYFDSYYTQFNLLAPPYGFQQLYKIYEESDVLQECVEAMQQNVDGFGYELKFLGDDVTERANAEVKKEFAQLTSFFDYANEKHSWMTIRKRMREDFEVLGNGAMEVIRNLRGEIQLVYHVPFKTVRMSKLEGRAISITTRLPRNGKIVPIKMRKKFRKYAQVTADGKALVWFKEYSDPRTMDATTGLYTNSPKVKATELMHFRHYFGGLPYGMPRWVAGVLDVMGRRSAQFVNYDLFESQGIPPMAIMVSGGTLTDESLEDLEDLIKAMRGTTQWNKVLILESAIESVGLEEKGTAKIELKNLSEFRKEDMMFAGYLKGAHDSTRYRFRLPPLYTGSSETYTHATAKASQVVAEEQIFIPERRSFDEMVNRLIVMREFEVQKWSYKSKGPEIVGAEEISESVEAFTDAGAISVNNAIELANRAYGLEMTKFEQEWANYPITIVLKVLEKQNFEITGLDALGKTKVIEAPKQTQLALPSPVPAKAVQKILKSDIFGEEEKELYRSLLVVQDLVERFQNAERTVDI